MMQVLPTYGTARSWIDTANSCFIQWIYAAIPDNSYYRDFVLPVTLKSRPFVVVPADVSVAAATKIDSGFLTYSYGGSTPSSVRIATDTPTISVINAIIVGI